MTQGNSRKQIHPIVRRDRAGDYFLTSLVAFGATVIITRVYLELTGYPQIGNDVLHIAHALWGGLLLIVASLMPLASASRRAIQISAWLGGIGTGLFIDEVGKLITQANDYFFPATLSIIYGVFLLVVLVYRQIGRPQAEDPRRALIHALEGMHDAVDGNLDSEETARIGTQLGIAMRSDRDEIVSLANAISDFVQKGKSQQTTDRPGNWRRTTKRLRTFGARFGRHKHRTMITFVLIGWLILVAGYIIAIVQGTPNLSPQVLQWRVPLIGIQAVVGVLMVAAAFFWLAGEEELGLRFGVGGLLVSLVALQLLYFYLSQFSAITVTLLQLAFLQVLSSYRGWYLGDTSRQSNPSGPFLG